LAGEDKHGQPADESAKNKKPDRPRAFERFGKLAIGDRPAGFGASHAFANQPASLEEVPHSLRCNYA
jgi:hypothetical protein